MRKQALAASVAVMASLLACGGIADFVPPSMALLDPSELAVVDCKMPPKIQRIGKKATYLAARQPRRLTVRDCQERGGEYTEPGRATVATALEVWLPAAEQGDPEAQRQVGEIFERGIGTAPDHARAAKWYRQAADQGLASAQFNLAYLYKLGLGVPRDLAEARRWFDKAAGPELRELLADSSAATPSEPIEIIDPPARPVSRGIDVSSAEPSDAPLRTVIGKVNLPAGIRTVSINEQKVEPDERGIFKIALPFTAEMQLQVVATDRKGARVERSFELMNEEPTAPEDAIDFGRYYALVIGNDAYEELRDLRTARADANAIAKILKLRYGFEVKVLLDATRRDIYNAIYDYVPKLTRQDNLLIYYAGHGDYDRTNERGFWLPVDAGPTNRGGAFSTTEITDLLNLMNARHILVIADSCYSGAVLRNAELFQQRGGLDAKQRREFLRTMSERRSITAMVSGGLEPVSDGRGNHSVFARALIDVLNSNDAVLEASRLFQTLQARVIYEAKGMSSNQSPEYAPIKLGGNEGGDFMFVPARVASRPLQSRLLPEPDPDSWSASVE